ncbi:hypothetical protein C8R47DRAFT_1228214 [Mycena vitilis]|nr:hypothetical protein C8R47DRAFT_1228214 [Mycena vitilis]
MKTDNERTGTSASACNAVADAGAINLAARFLADAVTHAGTSVAVDSLTDHACNFVADTRADTSPVPHAGTLVSVDSLTDHAPVPHAGTLVTVDSLTDHACYPVADNTACGPVADAFTDATAIELAVRYTFVALESDAANVAFGNTRVGDSVDRFWGVTGVHIFFGDRLEAIGRLFDLHLGSEDLLGTRNLRKLRAFITQTKYIREAADPNSSDEDA